MPSLWSLWWRIPAALLALTASVLVMVNAINALPQYEDAARLIAGGVSIYIQQGFFPWLRWTK